MGTEAQLVALSLAVLVSYWFSHLARRWRVPSVVFLLAAGLALRQLTDTRHSTVDIGPDLLPLLGTIGLILIVLEGGLDLNLRPGRRRFLLRTFGAAAAGVVLCTAALAAIATVGLGLAWPEALLMAVPFAVISSAVAIPSAEVLSDEDREFVIYESSWSDIVGVMVFNAVLVWSATGRGATLSLVGGGLAVALLGTAISLAVYWLVGHLEGHVKFVPLIFALIGVYAAAKAAHLSPLLIVLILGLMLNNAHLIRRFHLFDRLHSDHYPAELERLKHLTAEATFFVRTFFFLLLGYTTELRALADLRTWAVALSIVGVVFALRVPLLALLGAGRLQPLLWAAPRGLITVLLFYSLPAARVPDALPRGTLILVVLLSCGLMAVGFRRSGRTSPPQDEGAGVVRRLDAGAAPPP
jgi:cell volume regulation protein A